jgi:large subunit ribosomal protein LX
MSEFTVSGRFETPKGKQEFTRTIEAPNENVAEERTFSKFGAEHSIGRNRVEIDEVAA